MENEKIKIIECPRDAMQGIKRDIPTKDKANYINSLIQVGFDVIDFGSFVSHKAVPQMRDTSQVLDLLNLKRNTSLLAVVLNKRGALDASVFDQISILGYPLSISEIFQKKNSNHDIQSSLSILDEIYNICIQKNKTLLVYISMAFGNPYGEFWSIDVLLNYISKVMKKNISMISLADTIGNSHPHSIKSIYKAVSDNFPLLDVGLHLHSSPENAYKKIHTGWGVGCRRFDVTVNGYGGCPFADDKLVGNISTETILNFIANEKIAHSLDLLAFENAFNRAKEIFD